MAAAYSFTTHWSVPASPERCWAALDDVVRGRATWWRRIRVECMTADPGAAVSVGDGLELVVRSGIGYRLRLRLRVTAISPGVSITADSTGDLRGAGSVRLRRDGGGTRIVIRWDVVTTRRWMNAAAPVLRPVFTAAHDRVMARGERALRAALAGPARRSEPRNAGNPGLGRGAASGGG